MRVFVGLGEGIGNVVMGLPLVDALSAAGHEVTLALRPTPPSIVGELAALVCAGRRLTIMADEVWPADPFDAACLTHWWISRGGPLPIARESFIGGAPSESMPEIVCNLDAARTLAPDASQRAALIPSMGKSPAVAQVDRPCIGIHPGCKNDSEWKRRKVYPRWAEVTHRLKTLGAHVVVLGTSGDDAYCGEPHEDLRGWTTLVECAREIAGLDVLVSGDSGLHHVAVALGVPTVALFGGSSVVKATHPDAVVAPVIFGPCEAEESFAALDPREIAKAAMAAARVRISS